MGVYCGKCKYYKHKSGAYIDTEYRCKKFTEEKIHESPTQRRVEIMYGDAQEINKGNDCADFEYSNWRFIQKRRHQAMKKQEQLKAAWESVEVIDTNEEELLEDDN
jgi:hypothetical protein